MIGSIYPIDGYGNQETIRSVIENYINQIFYGL